MDKRSSVGAATFLFAAGLAALPIAGANAAVCVGSCGSSNAVDGHVTVSPAGPHQWISTSGGLAGVGQLAGIGGTNGSLFTTSAFTATAGETLSYWFNYITSDGAEYADYAWAQLWDTSSNVVATLLTARTKPDGSIIPGDGLPAIDASLTPPSVPIIDGAPNWSPLGFSSGTCYDDGCGYTGWVFSEYEIAANGTYVLAFGVSNWLDTAFDSGLAFGGLAIDGNPIDPIPSVPAPATLPLFITALAGLGFFRWRSKRQSV